MRHRSDFHASARSQSGVQEKSALSLSFPNVEEADVAGRGYLEITLPRCAIEGGADIRFRAGQFGQGNLDGTTRLQPFQVLEQLVNDLVMLALAAERQVALQDGLEMRHATAIASLSHTLDCHPIVSAVFLTYHNHTA